MCRTDRSGKDLFFLFSLLLLAQLLAPSAYAQVDTGAVLGTVSDQTGAVIPGAEVTITSETTAISKSMATRVDGTYVFTPVKVDSYSISVEFKGFKKVTREHVMVNIQSPVLVDFKLEPGAVTQLVVVRGSATLLQTTDASVGQVVGARQINELPLNGRNYTFLAQLSAGVTFAQQDNLGNAGATGMDASGSFVANGNRPAQNNFMLNGVDNNNTQPDSQSGWRFAVIPAIDALEEFKVQTEDYSAELSRAAGAVLNVTIKSGTDKIHGDVWEFVRNDKFDAADFFENATGALKGEYRQNQFGGTLGGPLKIPWFSSGNRRTFFFIDYEGTRIREGNPQLTTVPTGTERNSGYMDLSDILNDQPGKTPADDLGRTFSTGQVFDPATTRPVTVGQVDPVTNLVATSTGYVRDPFAGNILPATRLDQRAIALLNLYPLPTSPGLFNNYFTNVPLTNDTNSADARIDQSFGDHDQLFLSVSYDHSDRFNPPPFTGPAQGGGYFSGTFGITADSSVFSETHTFSPTTVNEFRLGFVRHSNDIAQVGENTLGIPQSFGIPGIPQYPGNGGLPTLYIGGLNELGSAGYQPIFKNSNLWDVRENLTKVQGAHVLKFGGEYQFNFIPYLVPPTSRGAFDFSGDYTSIPGADVGSVGISQLLLKPMPATVPNGVDNVGAADEVDDSSFVRSTLIRKYVGAYLQDDWRVSRNLTVNLGLRYDYFTPYTDRYNVYANMVPGAPSGGAEYLYPKSRKDTPPPNFLSALQSNGIAFTPSSNVYGTTSKDNFAPRVGLAYHVKPNIVARAGYGMFYGGFENSGGISTMGAFNFPFLFTVGFPEPDPEHPLTPDNSIGLLENGLSNVALNPSLATGFKLRGWEYAPRTAYAQGANASVQFQLTPNQSFQVGYVGTFARHLMTSPGANNDSEILPPLVNPQNYVPYHSFGRGFGYTTFDGNSFYHSLQVTFERRFNSGLNFLADYTWSACRQDARDRDVDNSGGYRAPGLPGFGIRGDYSFCDYDVRNMVHFSGTYQLPFGSGKKFLTNSSRLANAVLGGWTINSILTLQDGQPFTIPCNVKTAAGLGCNALFVPGENRIGGLHNVNQWMNPAAFMNPPVATAIGQTDYAPLGGEPTQLAGPGFHRLDFSMFKQFQTSERTHLEFRGEFFNLTNTPNFSIPLNTNFSSPAFGQITMTRDTPNDPRQIQLALKFYW